MIDVRDNNSSSNNNSDTANFYFTLIYQCITETRLRSVDRLWCNLRAADAQEEAAALGFAYPIDQADAINDALAAVSRLQEVSEVPSFEEEEIVVREWNEEREEFEDSILS